MVLNHVILLAVETQLASVKAGIRFNDVDGRQTPAFRIRIRTEFRSELDGAES